MRTLRCGIVGMRRGLVFIRVLKKVAGVEIVGLADPDPAARDRARDLLVNQPVIEADYLEDLLDQLPDLDFVVLAFPPPGRVNAAIAALDRGVSVLAEIPAVQTLDEAERLIAAVERSSATYMMAENCVYWGFVQAAGKMARDGAFGSLFYAEAEMMQDMRKQLRDANGQPTWRLDRRDPIVYCSHSLGPLFRITGQYPTEVICLGTSGNYEPGMSEIQTALIRLTDGGLVRLTVSLLNAHWHGHRFALFGTVGSFDTGWVWIDRPKMMQERVHTKPVELLLGPEVAGAPLAARQTGEAAMNWLMVSDFVNALRSGSPPPVDIYDALMFSVPGVLAAQSAANGGVAVAIPQYQLRRPDRSG